MLTQGQLEEIREHLENARNPVFFFDNDADGLASFLILRRFIGRGRGVSLKGLPSLNKAYYKKAEEFNSDYIFVLDRPGVDDEVVELNKKEKNLPIVCIDHHQLDREPNIDSYYNTYAVSGKSEPASYLCYKATGRQEDLWLAVIGCIGDWYIPDFFEEFKEKYPELVDCNYQSPADILYKTELGKIIMILNLAMKDTTTNVVSMYKYLMNACGPKDILEENSKTKVFLERYDFLNKSVKKIVKKAEEILDKKDNLLFFTYSGDMSLSQHVSDELIYHYPDWRIAVGFIKGSIVKFSMRGDKIRTLMVAAIKNIDGASGGGHELSCGAQVPRDKVEEFKENLFQEIRKLKKKN